MRELMLQEAVEMKQLPAVRETTNPITVRETTEIASEEVIKKKIAELRSMGFEQVAKKAESAHKMTIAYGKYMFISQETVDRFNDKLRKETLEEDSRTRHYKKLVFIPIDKYQQIPPVHVLNALSIARKMDLFDRFEIGKIDWIKEIKDPIVFGRIDGCEDRFFISQWDDDVKIEDLLNI